jgi:hypothetical protein
MIPLLKKTTPTNKSIRRSKEDIMTKKTFARSLSVLAAALLAIVIGLSASAVTARASEVTSTTNMGIKAIFFDFNHQGLQRPDFHLSLLARVEKTNGEAELGADAESLSSWQPVATLLSSFDIQMSEQNIKNATDYVLVAGDDRSDVEIPDIVTDLPLWITKDGVEYGIEYTFAFDYETYRDGSSAEFVRVEKASGYRYDADDGFYTIGDYREPSEKYEKTLFWVFPDGGKDVDLNVSFDDQNNAYGLRPDSVEFALQRTSDGGQTWEYVTAHGSVFEGVFADASGTINSNIVTVTSNNYAEVRDLPPYAMGDSSKTYLYRPVEIVRGKYYRVSNTDAEVVDVSEDGSTQIIATTMTQGLYNCHSNFTNSLVYTGSTGYVSFEGVNPYEFRPVTLTLQCSIDGQTWTDVVNAPTPVIINSPLEKKFFIFYMNIPAYDTDDNAYSYRVVQDPLEGFSTTYYTNDGAVTDAIYQGGIARNVLN